MQEWVEGRFREYTPTSLNWQMIDNHHLVSCWFIDKLPNGQVIYNKSYGSHDDLHDT